MNLVLNDSRTRSDESKIEMNLVLNSSRMCSDASIEMNLVLNNCPAGRSIDMSVEMNLVDTICDSVTWGCDLYYLAT